MFPKTVVILVEKNQNSISFGGYSGSDGDGGWWRKTKTTNALVVQPQPCCSFSPPPEEKRVQLFGLPPPPFPPDGSFKERRNYQNQSQNFKEKFLGFGSGKEKLLISEENRENQILEKSDASVSFFSWGTIKQGDIMKSKGRIKLKRDQVHKGYFWGLGLKIDSHLCSGFYLAKLKHLNLDENSQCVYY